MVNICTHTNSLIYVALFTSRHIYSVHLKVKMHWDTILQRVVLLLNSATTQIINGQYVIFPARLKPEQKPEPEVQFLHCNSGCYKQNHNFNMQFGSGSTRTGFLHLCSGFPEFVYET